MSDVLVAFFPHTGRTRKIAEKISNENGYDIFEIVPEKIYNPEDFVFIDKKMESVRSDDKPFRLPIREIPDITNYDTIVIGFPLWWYAEPSIINTFIESLDLSGKKIKAFCTSEWASIEKCVNDLANSYPELNFADGMIFVDDVSKAKEWIEE